MNRFRFLSAPAKTAYAAGAFVYKYDDATDTTSAMATAAAPQGRTVASEGALTVSIGAGRDNAEVSVRVFSPDTGALVRTVMEAVGRSYDIAWDLRDDAGVPIPPGVYFLRTTIDGLSKGEEIVVREAAQPNVSFAVDIKPLFRNSDRDAMIPNGIDLFDYQQVKFRADDIRARLEDGSMPCDRAWPKEWIQKFKQWIAGGIKP